MSSILPVKLSSSIKLYAGIDPGFLGSLAILLGNSPIIIPTPIINIKVKKRTKGKGMHEVNKKLFDMQKMYDSLAQFKGCDVSLCIEKVSTMPGESPISSFIFGEGYGYWKMAAVACGFKYTEIRPAEWKEFFPQLLASSQIEDIRESIKALRGQVKVTKDKKQNNRIKLDISTLNRQLKGLAKDAAREYAAKLYPEVADMFKLKKNDGAAEAMLICHYCKYRS